MYIIGNVFSSHCSKVESFLLASIEYGVAQIFITGRNIINLIVTMSNEFIA